MKFLILVQGDFHFMSKQINQNYREMISSTLNKDPTKLAFVQSQIAIHWQSLFRRISREVYYSLV